MSNLTEFQKKHFERLGVKANAEHAAWPVILEVTKSRETLLKFLMRNGSYSDRWTAYDFHWNVSASGVEVDFEKFKDYIKDYPWHAKTAETYPKLYSEVYENLKVELFWDACSLAREGFFSGVSNTLGAVYSNVEVEAKLFTLGRCGKHLCLESFEDKLLKDSETLAEEEFDDEFLVKLAMFVAILDEELTSKKIEEEVERMMLHILVDGFEKLAGDRGIGEWEIVDAFEYHGKMYKRVRHVGSGEESMLGTQEECEAIIKAAEAGQLMGSFGLILNPANLAVNQGESR